MEAIGVAFTTVAQDSTIGGQGGPSDLHWFIAHHPPSFRGGGDLMVADHWFRQVESVLEVIGITSNVTRIRLADWAKVSRDRETMTWGEF